MAWLDSGSGGGPVEMVGWSRGSGAVKIGGGNVNMCFVHCLEKA